MCPLLCVIIVAMESFKKKGGDYLLTIALENCCHNSFPEFSIKINCITTNMSLLVNVTKSQVLKEPCKSELENNVIFI